MSVTRRGFVAGAVAAALTKKPDVTWAAPSQAAAPADRFDPWLEIDPAALRHNVQVVSGLAAGRPILAVVKNNAYGLGLATVAAALEPLSEIMGFAVVKTEAALALRDAGVRKPVLLMGLMSDEDVVELLSRDVSMSLCTDDSAARVMRAVERVGRTPRVHAYVDTGMSRMGVPYHRALPWLAGVTAMGLRLESTFMGFTEDAEFDREQLRRFLAMATAARSRGIELGALHAASSAAVFNFAAAHLAMVRPGIALYGAYPSDAGTERSIAELRPAVRLSARVVRVERLRVGDSVSYGRQYVADRPTWVATLPVGHADGYPREAPLGARVLINGALYPVIGAVSASHTIVELGETATVAIGDVATLVGPDHPAIHPNAVATATGRSVYDVLMHLSPSMPKVVV